MLESKKFELDTLSQFFHRLEKDKSFTRYFAQVAGEPGVVSADYGAKDHFLRRLTRRIEVREFPVAVMDFGCGEGRFLAALLDNHHLPLQNITMLE